MQTARPRTALLKTSAATDVKRGGVQVDITGLGSIFEKDIIKIQQYRNRAEVVKVETIGNTSYTPAANTKYIVEIYDSARREGVANSNIPRRYVYITPANITDIGATPALQRETIHAGLITKINLDSGNNVVAVTLGTGTGFTITDDAGYFPAKTAGGINPRQGASIIHLAKDENGRGFSDATDRTVTTAAVYQFGEGSRLSSDFPVVWAWGGQNVIAGDLDCPLTTSGEGPVSGQKYDAFSIESLVISAIPTVGNGTQGFRVEKQVIFVDNGLGSSTTNRTGFLAFERQMLKLIFLNLYASDPKSVIEFFDEPILFQGAAGAVPTTTGENKLVSPYGALVYNQIGTETITVPTPGNGGLNLDQDATDTEGAAYTPSLGTLCDKKFVVGKNPFSVIAKVIATDWTDVYLKIGFRKKAAHAADFNDYTDAALVGTDSTGDDFYTHGILNNAATVSTDTGVNGTDSTVAEFRVHVDIAGRVSCYIDNVKYPIYSAGTTALILDAGDEMIPHLEATNIGGGDPDAIISVFVAVADDNWKIDQ